MTAPFIHGLLTLSDALDRTCDEMPEPVCAEQRVLLSALARACQITAETLKAEAAEMERRLVA